jgi:hypothetical protein
LTGKEGSTSARLVFSIYFLPTRPWLFSPARRVRDNTTKHTLQNILEVPEVVINIVSYEMVQQTSLASCEYPKGTDEFVKAGFTKEPATVVRPPRFNITLIWRIPFSYPCASGF